MRKILFSAITAIFLISIAVVFINVFSGMRFFDFDSILSSPKSSYSIGGTLGIFFSNFYTLIFGISPIALIFVILFLIRNTFKNNFEKDNFKIVTYLLLFIFVYYAGSVASHVASIIRYQLILFPIFFITAGIAAAQLSDMLFGKSKAADIGRAVFSLLLIASLATVLYVSKPFYMSYASSLLPDTYYLDLKDMGSGSYEAAQYLNSLPNPEKLVIWSDKSGVCTFFAGSCKTSLSITDLQNIRFDYFVLSSGRQSRTTKMMALKTFDELSFEKLYSDDRWVYKLELGNRPDNYVKIIKKDYALGL
jgi:hypothetical protein